jgi:hypothetical protein
MPLWARLALDFAVVTLTLSEWLLISYLFSLSFGGAVAIGVLFFFVVPIAIALWSVGELDWRRRQPTTVAEYLSAAKEAACVTAVVCVGMALLFRLILYPR